MAMDIKRLDSIKGWEEELSLLLVDSVESGASVGFLPPLGEKDALLYWQQVEQALEQGERCLLVAIEQDHIVGAVQLSFSQKANALHRAEVEKLMVHTASRGQGIAKRLMSSLEMAARERRRHLLVLDTRLGDVASTLYRRMGYQEVGQIPDFALSASGTLDATVLFFKQLNLD